MIDAATVRQPDVSGATLLFIPQDEGLFEFSVRVPEKGVQYSGSLAVEQVELTFAFDDAQASSTAEQPHGVSFLVPFASKEYLKYSRVKQRANVAAELLFLLPPSQLPSMLRIARPAPTLRLIAPQDRSILEVS